MPAVSVLVAASGRAEALRPLLRSVDAQTLPAAEFEVVVAAAPEPWLTDLAARRPNVVLVDHGGWLPAALEGATGEHVLILRERDVLTPRALETLLAAVRRTGADAALGRACSPGASGSADLPDDAERADRPPEQDRVVTLVRRAALPAEPAAALAPDALPATGVAVVGRYACVLRDAERVAPRALDAASWAWRDGALHLAVPAPSGADRAWLVLVRDGAEIALPARIADGGITAALEPRTAECGGPLSPGPWRLALRTLDGDREAEAALPVPRALPAVVDGLALVLREGVLDVGATTGGLLGAVAVPDASVQESVRGVLIGLRHPGVHVHGDAVLDGRVLLGRFSMPARLLCEGGSARTEAWIGSLAGTSPVRVAIGASAPGPTGLRLRVDGVGGMRFVSQPAAADGPSRRPAAQRLRRRLPATLDPVLRRAARVPLLRDAYRRLIGR